MRRARWTLTSLATALAVAAVFAQGASAAQEWYLNTDWAPTILPSNGTGGFQVELGNRGDTPMASPPVVTVELPAGVQASGQYTAGSGCVGTGTSLVTCTLLSAPGAYRAQLPNKVLIGLTITAGATPGPNTVTTTVSGGGAPTVSTVDQVTIGSAPSVFGVIPGTFTAGAFDQAGNDYTQAGGHPYDAMTSFDLAADEFIVFGNEGARSVGGLKDAVVDLPAGFVGNPEALPKCPDAGALRARACPPESQVGTAYIEALGAPRTQGSGVFNMVPERGAPAQFAFYSPGGISMLTPLLRPDGNYAISVKTKDINESAPIRGVARVTLWGVPSDPVHDVERCAVPNNVAEACVGIDPVGGAPSGEFPPDSYSPHASTAPPLAFLTNPTECTGQPVKTLLHLSNWDDPGQYRVDGLPDLGDPSWDSSTAEAPALTGCADVPFQPSFDMALDTSRADAPTSLTVDLGFPQDGLLDPAALATAHLKKSVVTLPAGVSVNPSGATGLTGCSNTEMGLVQPGNPSVFNDDDPFDDSGAECPDGSKIGTVEVQTPLLSEKLTGDVVLGTPESTDPQSGKMFRLFLVLRNPDRGLLVKIFGSAVADPGTGQLTATFDSNPQLPLSDLQLKFKGGQHAMLASPQGCGERTWTSTFTPWTASAGGVPRDISGSFTTSECPSGFGPSLQAGMSSQAASGSGTFSFNFARRDGEQWFRGLTAKLPTGLLASLQHVDLCTDAQANANACPLGSQIGIADAAAGAGSPFVLERKGRVYLTEGYKGGEFGLAVSVPVEAGPFRGDMALSPIVVRQAIHVDRRTAQVTVVSDPLPLIHHGVPLRVREVTVNVDRPRFMRNPTDCAAKQVGADIVSTEGTTANLAVPFRAADCAALPFRPRLRLALTGRGQRTTGKHPGIRAVVTQRRGEADIAHAEVRLPKSLALDPDNAQALCEFEDGTKPDLENHCPAGSIVGRARAISPLLEQPLVGNVYFVKNIRTDPETGNTIRTLPMIIVALRGQISINLRGESDVKGGKLVNTFANVPDAPISRFNLNIKGGSTGIIAVTRTRKSRVSLCRGKHIAEADMDGHNGKRHDRNIRMKTPCPTTKQAKGRAGAKRRGA